MVSLPDRLSEVLKRSSNLNSVSLIGKRRSFYNEFTYLDIKPGYKSYMESVFDIESDNASVKSPDSVSAKDLLISSRLKTLNVRGVKLERIEEIDRFADLEEQQVSCDLREDDQCRWMSPAKLFEAGRWE